MSDAPATTTPPPPPPAAAASAGAAGAGGDAGTEHLGRLHRMSTTAGVTNLDYVAVNQTAIVAVVIALLGALALVSPMFLVLPVAGVVTAAIALRQIRGSVGTQSGRAIAWAAIALSAGLGVAEGAIELAAGVRLRADERKIEAAIAQLGGLLHEAKYDRAYRLFDDDFQNRVTAKEFARVWQQTDALGRIDSLAWNGVTPKFLPGGGTRLAYANARIKFPKADEQRVVVVLRQVGGEWQLANVPVFFPGPDKQQQKAQDDVFQIPQE
jgi:hypothetical protein